MLRSKIHRATVTGAHLEYEGSLTIDQDLCNACSLCVRQLGCPAILVTDGVFTIDEDLCDGCELCAQVCQHDAIESVDAKRVS